MIKYFMIVLKGSENILFKIILSVNWLSNNLSSKNFPSESLKFILFYANHTGFVEINQPNLKKQKK